MPAGLAVTATPIMSSSPGRLVSLEDFAGACA
jgi:hypothetical protein